MTDAQIVDGILALEGGYVHHPADHGGPTNYGITQTTLAQWRHRPVTVADVQDLPIDEARDIYSALYVRPFDGVDPSVKAQVVDIAVNSGVSRARTLLAKAEQGPRPLPIQLVIERLEYYAGVVAASPSQAVFLKGWTRRAVSFLCLLLLSGCSLRHQVQFVSPSWNMPPGYAQCQPRGDMVRIDGRWQVVSECLDGLRMFDRETHRETEFVAWAEVGK